MKECSEEILEAQSCFFFFLLCSCNDFISLYEVCPFNVLNIKAKTMKYTLTSTVKHLVLFMFTVREALLVYLNCRIGKLCEVGYKSKSILEFAFLERKKNSATHRLSDLLVQLMCQLDVL